MKCVQIRSFFWSVFSRIRTEYGEIRSISPNSVQVRENTDQKKNSVFGHFSHSACSKSYIAWRSSEQALNFRFIDKGSHGDTSGTVAHFMVTIACGKGVTTAEQQPGKIRSKKLFTFVRENLADMFKKRANYRGELFSQSSDPPWNSAKVRAPWYKVGEQILTIPARCSDLSLIENIFFIVKRILHHDALKLK